MARYVAVCETNYYHAKDSHLLLGSPQDTVADAARQLTYVEPMKPCEHAPDVYARQYYVAELLQSIDPSTWDEWPKDVANAARKVYHPAGPDFDLLAMAANMLSLFAVRDHVTGEVFLCRQLNCGKL